MKNIVISIIIVVAGFFLITVQTKKVKDNKINYVALGDSIATGYALPEYTNGKECEGSYVSLVKQMLGETYPGHNIEFSSMTENGITIDGLYSKIQKNPDLIKNADIITVSIGSNDLLNIFENIISKNLGDINISESIESNDINSMKNFYNKLLNVKNELTDNAELISVCDSFPEKLNNLYTLINSISPDADIYFTNIYNPFNNVTIPGINLFNIANSYINRVNSSFNDSGYVTADIYNAFLNSKENVVNIQDNLSSLDPHPNINGHKIISEEVMKNIILNTKDKFSD